MFETTYESIELCVFVPEAGLEPARPCGQWILSPSRLPFRHSGRDGDCREVHRAYDPGMGRLETRLFAINDALAALSEEERLVEAELVHHRHIDDDAQRDAAVSGWQSDRMEAASTAADVARFERRMREISDKREKLERRRRRLIDRLG